MDPARATACNWAISALSCNTPREIGRNSAYLRVIDFPDLQPYLEKHRLDLGINFALEGFPS
ncbi:MAG: hypothetical protein ABSB68_17225, partial [Acidimicrobiales bacterium]